MSKQTKRTIVLAVGIVFVIMLIAGCEEENQIDTKKSRLIAAENIQLKKELERLSIKSEQHNKEIEKQKELLEQCEQAKKVIAEQSAKDVGDLFDSILGDVLKESQSLHEENEKLKAQIKQLEAQVQQLEKELQELKRPGPQPL